MRNPCSEAELVLARVPSVGESARPSVDMLILGREQITYPEGLTGPINFVRLSSFGQRSGPGWVRTKQDVYH